MFTLVLKQQAFYNYKIQNKYNIKINNTAIKKKIYKRKKENKLY